MPFAFSSTRWRLLRQTAAATLAALALLGMSSVAAQIAIALPAEVEAALTRSGLPRDALMKQRQRKAGLQFNNQRLLTLTHSNNIRRTDLALDHIPLPLKHPLDG